MLKASCTLASYRFIIYVKSTLARPTYRLQDTCASLHTLAWPIMHRESSHSLRATNNTQVGTGLHTTYCSKNDIIIWGYIYILGLCHLRSFNVEYTLPGSIKSSTSVELFKHRLKTHLFSEMYIQNWLCKVHRYAMTIHLKANCKDDYSFVPALVPALCKCWPLGRGASHEL